MTQFGISITRMKELRRRMYGMKIFEKDIKETFVRSSGPGGQNVNKVATCVCLMHIPTGMQVKSQSERSQGLNRFRARLQLIAKIERKQAKRMQEKAYERAKKKRQTRKRPKALKEKILETKKQVSQKKQSRRKINPCKIDDFV